MIEGVLKLPLRQIEDARGKVMHMLRNNDSHFEQFGEIYFSWIYPKAIKAWKKHVLMAGNFVVPVGFAKVVIFDDREASQTLGKLQVFDMSADEYFLLTVPKGVWYGFGNFTHRPTLIVNCATLPHDPAEVINLDPFDPRIPYNWKSHND